MYLLLVVLGMVILMHSFLLVSVLRKNEELSKKVNFLLRRGNATQISEGKRFIKSAASKKTFSGSKHTTYAKGEKPLR